MDLVDCIAQYIALPGETECSASWSRPCITMTPSNVTRALDEPLAAWSQGCRIGALRRRRNSTVHNMKLCGTDDGAPFTSSPEARDETFDPWRLLPSRPHCTCFMSRAVAPPTLDQPAFHLGHFFCIIHSSLLSASSSLLNNEAVLER